MTRTLKALAAIAALCAALIGCAPKQIDGPPRPIQDCAKPAPQPVDGGLGGTGVSDDCGS